VKYQHLVKLLYYINIVIHPAASKKLLNGGLRGGTRADVSTHKERDVTSFSGLQMLGNSANHERPFDAMLNSSTVIVVLKTGLDNVVKLLK
jgi:hypothetical protein